MARCWVLTFNSCSATAQVRPPRPFALCKGVVQRSGVRDLACLPPPSARNAQPVVAAV